MKTRLIAGAVIGMLLLSLCAGCSDQTTSAGGKIVFGEAGWDSMKFHNAVAMFIAAEAYDMQTQEVSGSTGVTYSALLKGDIQVYMETWTDNLPTYQQDLAAEKIRELSVNYADNAQGIYVPRYVVEGDAARGIEPVAPNLKTVADLKEYFQVFVDPDDRSKGRLYGAISGWEAGAIMQEKYLYYGLDENYTYMDPGSDAALAAAISAAYERGNPIAAYYWEPAWITGKYDLLLLEDAPYDESLYHAGQCAFPSVTVTVCVNEEFYQEEPEFCAFLSKYTTSSMLTAEALSYMQETGATDAETALWFLRSHDELISEWLPEDKADQLREKLSQY